MKKFLKITLLTCLILIIAFISFILYQTKDEINADLENIEQKINSFYNKNEMAGFAVSVFNSDSIIYSQGFGFADVDQKIPYTTETLQYIASISKTTIGVSLLKAQELGLLSLDDPINLHLPFKIYNPNFPDSEITIQQLATHTSSMVYNEQFVESLYINDNKKDASLKQILEDYFVNGLYGEVSFSDHLPGAVWDYSNSGAGLAAYIIEYKSGLTYEDFTQKYIFEPLRMDNTYWFESKADSSIFSRYYEPIDDKSIVEAKTSGVKLYPARDMITNVKDLTKFGQAILSMNPDLLSAQSYKNMLGAKLTGSVIDQTVDNCGIFWIIDRNQYGITYQMTGMNGGDYCINTMMWLDPKTNLGYIFIGNTGSSISNKANHILIYRTLVSLGDKIVMENPNSTFLNKLDYKWHNLYSRVAGLF